MDRSLLWRATAAQAITVGALFAVLVALPLPVSFFREYGSIVGPLSWLACALFVALVVRLPAVEAVAAAAVSGALAVATALALGHTAGMLTGVAGFGVTCGMLASRRAGGRRVPAAFGAAPARRRRRAEPGPEPSRD